MVFWNFGDIRFFFGLSVFVFWVLFFRYFYRRWEGDVVFFFIFFVEMGWLYWRVLFRDFLRGKDWMGCLYSFLIGLYF